MWPPRTRCSGATFSNTARISRCRWFCWWMAKAGRARFTADVPSAAQMRADLARIDQGHALALPFPGKYYLNPRRNYFKLGAAFYWAGYPDRALPYLAETLRTRPENWKALHAMARIQLELGRNQGCAGIVPAGDRRSGATILRHLWARAKRT